MTNYGISPDCFGPPLWTFLHMISFNYPDYVNENSQDGYSLKINTYNFFTSLGHVIPCPICKEHYFQRLSSKDLFTALNSRATFSKFVYDFHDDVNKSLGKISPSFEEVSNKYLPLISSDCSKNTNTCSSNSFYCDVKLLPKTNEYFSETSTTSSTNSYDQNTTYSIIGGVCGFVVIVIIMYMLVNKSSKTKHKSHYSHINSYRY